jgi:hypothetical protein
MDIETACREESVAPGGGGGQASQSQNIRSSSHRAPSPPPPSLGHEKEAVNFQGGVAAVAPLRIHIHLGQSKTVCRSDVIISTDPVSRKKIDEGGEEFTRELSGQGGEPGRSAEAAQLPLVFVPWLPWRQCRGRCCCIFGL